ncbi:MAG: isoprenylcysteine carboxylmethyltransferase family protein [Bacteroidetes bacterium]|nr:isoprenylcysteine carboxylmethyltransferase family protein [Bacteroidota bacterium]
MFKYRSYTPIPILIVAVGFQEATATSLIVGFAIAVLGELIRMTGVAYAGSFTRTVNPDKCDVLIVNGHFGIVRNPLYAGNIIIYLGIGLMSNAFFPYFLIAAFFYFIIQYTLIVSMEEDHLLSKHGDKFQRYLNSVNRWLPKFKVYSDPEIEKATYNFKRGFKSEIRTIQALLAVALIITILYWI